MRDNIKVDVEERWFDNVDILPTEKFYIKLYWASGGNNSECWNGFHPLQLCSSIFSFWSRS